MTMHTVLMMDGKKQQVVESLLEHIDIIDYEIKIVDVCTTAAALREVLRMTKPDLVIMDPGIDQGHSLKSWHQRYGTRPSLMCITTDARFAMDAFDAGAAHYILLPLDLPVFMEGLSRIRRQLLRNASYGATTRERLFPFYNNLVALPGNKGIDLRPSEQIIRVRGEGSYSRFFLAKESAKVLAKSIGECEKVLARMGFVRVHRSNLVNVQHISRILRGKAFRLLMSNGDEVEISDRYRNELLSILPTPGRH